MKNSLSKMARPRNALAMGYMGPTGFTDATRGNLLPSAAGLRKSAEAAASSQIPGIADMASGALAVDDARRGNWGQAGLNALGMLPFVPAMGGMVAAKKVAPRLISSQRFLDDATVAKKLDAEDYDVFLSPEFEVDGELMQVIQDGHHSFAAAKKAGVAPNFIEQSATENDKIGLLLRGDIEGFLEASYMDSPYYYYDTGKDVW